MEVFIPFESKIVKRVFEGMEMYESLGKFPENAPEQALEILECLLYLGFDVWLEYLAPCIAQRVHLLDSKIIRQFPPFLKEGVVNMIPVSTLDPDFVVEHFGLELLVQRVSHSSIPKENEVPFSWFSPHLEETDANHVANSLMHYDKRFAEYEFTRKNCTRVNTKCFVDLSEFECLEELNITNAGKTIDVSLMPMLRPTLKRLEITKTKLTVDQLHEVYDFVKRGGLVSLSLRETRIGSLHIRPLIEMLQKREIGGLKFLDVGSNELGASEVDRLLEAANFTSLEGVAVDANFFKPSASALRHLVNTKLKIISIRGLHWDRDSADTFALAMKSQSPTFWDFSAQVVHMHSDPDLSSEMTEYVLKQCAKNVTGLCFSNHRLCHVNLSCLADHQLKGLGLSNANIQDDTLEHIVPLFNHLVFLDLSTNSLTLKDRSIITALAHSPTLRYLFLSGNDIGDPSGRLLFEEMLETGSKIKHLRLRNCSLRGQSSHALINLLGSGTSKFYELDVGGNEMFHVARQIEGPMKTSKVQILFIDGNNVKAHPAIQLLNVISGTQFIDLGSGTKTSTIVKLSPHCRGISGISMNRASSITDTELITIATHTQAQELWVVHSVSQKTVSAIATRYTELPRCMAIHVGTDVSPPTDSKIPFIVDHV